MWPCFDELWHGVIAEVKVPFSAGESTTIQALKDECTAESSLDVGGLPLTDLPTKIIAQSIDEGVQYNLLHECLAIAVGVWIHTGSKGIMLSSTELKDPRSFARWRLKHSDDRKRPRRAARTASAVIEGDASASCPPND